MITARIWRERAPRYRNEISKCVKCAATYFPPRAICPACGGGEMTRTTMPETGKVLTWSIVRNSGPMFAAEVPYAVAILEMDDGTRLVTQVADVTPEEMKTGMRVRLEFRKIQQQGKTGVIAYAHKAVPILDVAGA